MPIKAYSIQKHVPEVPRIEVTSNNESFEIEVSPSGPWGPVTERITLPKSVIKSLISVLEDIRDDR